MPDVTVTFNERTYRLSCDPGEVERLLILSREVKSRLDALLTEHGPVGDDRLLLMASITLADDLLDAITARDAALLRAETAERSIAPKPSRKAAAGASNG
jgi:cell division protein ZapA